jgi:hypothetical protein
MGECVVRLLSDKQPQMEAMAVEPTLEDFYFATIKGLSV